MFVVDTNVISELRKRDRAHRNVLAWADSAKPTDFFLSCITLQELQYGALLIERRDPAQGALMRRWVSRDILAGFAGRILPLDEAVAMTSAALHVPDRRPERDAWIAATALVHGMAVVTRNVRDFEPMGVGVVNPWEAAP